MGGAVGKSSSSSLEAKIVAAMKRRATQGSAIKSFNTIILKFPKIDHSLRKCNASFQLFDEDSNGVLDQPELNKCFLQLGISLTEEEMADFFFACDFNDDLAIRFNEFIVLLCLLYLLKDHQAKLKTAMPDLEATFETLVDAFVFLDKNRDGYVSKTEMVEALNETTSGESSSNRIALKRFEEMDWDNNGMVNFKEFLFAFTRWVGIDEADDDDQEEDEAAAQV